MGAQMSLQTLIAMETTEISKSLVSIACLGLCKLNGEKKKNYQN